MAKRTGIQAHQEWKSDWTVRDARPASLRFANWLSHPRRASIAAASIGVTGFAAPALAVPALFLGGLLSVWYLGFGRYSRQMPLQVPKQADALDHSTINPKTRKPGKGEGIFYLGNDRVSGDNEECWISNTELRTHMLVAGTTGSGKTMTLLGKAFNALCWGSGFIYVDGKADNSLPFAAYSLARRMGREDSFFVLNFDTGGVDPFLAEKSEKRLSNNFNPFSRGAADELTQLMSSLMAEAGGDNAMWKGLAVGMLDAVIRGLCYKRAKEGLEIDAAVIRDSIDLSALIAMVRDFQRRPDIPRELVLKPLESYLLNLPGLNWDEHVNGDEPPGPETKKQHDFRSMQFLRQLTLLADTYGQIFKRQVPEVDIMDIVLNNRILIVMIPSLAKSEEESAAVGKLVITALRMMMALNLGNQVEGMYQDAVESKATNSPSPYIVILDELGYYFAKGLAVIFAQARSLGFAMIAAMQDFPALMKGANKEEAESVIANTKFKASLAMEDPEKTGDFFVKAAGKGVVSEVAGFTGNSGTTAVTYRDQMTASLQERDRVTMRELKDLDTADGIVLWRDKVVRATTFTPFILGAKMTTKFPVKLNRLIGMFAPSIAGDRRDLDGFCEALDEATRNVGLNMERFIVGDMKPRFDASATDPACSRALAKLTATFPERSDIAPKDGDIALFIRFGQIAAEKAGSAMPASTGSAASGSGAGIKFSDLAAAAEPVEMIGDEIDVAGFPVVEVSLADKDASGVEDWMRNVIMGATESEARLDDGSVSKRNLEVTEMAIDLLAKVDSAISAKPPGDAAQSERALLEAVEYEVSKPPASPIDEDAAAKNIDALFADILG